MMQPQILLCRHAYVSVTVIGKMKKMFQMVYSLTYNTGHITRSFPGKDGARPALFQNVLCCSMYCLLCDVLCIVCVCV